MPIDPRQLRPPALCQLLNSTPLGEVITTRQLQQHRNRAGLRIGNDRHVDLIRYAAWLALERHAPQHGSAQPTKGGVDLAQAALGAAALGSRSKQVEGHGQKLTSRQEILIAALLTEPTYAAAAAKAGVAETTVYRWLQIPSFRTAYRRARREIVESAIGRIQSATGQAVETLLTIARQGRRDGDRVRASVALLDHACQGLQDGDLITVDEAANNAKPVNTTEVVATLAARMRQIEQSGLPTADKARLTATLADALLRAIGVDVLDKRLEALQGVLLKRKDKAKP
jgi:hypothetical protein